MNGLNELTHAVRTVPGKKTNLSGAIISIRGYVIIGMQASWGQEFLTVLFIDVSPEPRTVAGLLTAAQKYLLMKSDLLSTE